MSRFLVTGVAGFVGSHLAEALITVGHRVIGIDSFTDYYGRELKETNLLGLRKCSDFELCEMDLSTSPLEEVVASSDGVFHLAAQAGVRGSWGDGFDVYTRDNILASQRVFEAAARLGRRVVFASSSSVYGDAAAYPTTEDAGKSPISPYGVTKLCCETLAGAYRKSLKLDYVALRYFTVYGPRQRPDMAFTRLVRALVIGDEFRLFGDGTQSRDVTYVGDAVAATMAAMFCDAAAGAYNIGGGCETSMNEVIDMLESLSGERLRVVRDGVALGDVRRTAADIRRAELDLDWSPRVGLREGLGEQLAWAHDAASGVTRVAQGVGSRL